MSQYVTDILSQPDALQAALDGFDPGELAFLAARLRAGVYDRVILTGMGSSYFGGYPAWLHLVGAGIPAWHVETSELLHYAPELVTPRTLLWVISQSGESAEIIALLQRTNPGHLLAITNTPGSTLEKQAHTALLLHAGIEMNVSTKTYLNTLAVVQLAAHQLTGTDLAPAIAELTQLIGASRAYLANLDQNVAAYAGSVGLPQRLLYLGRGPSLASVFTGALTTKESTKFTVEGMSSGQFRHGPLELADDRLSIVILAGEPATLELHRRLAVDLKGYGVHVTWVGRDAPTGIASAPSVAATGVALPIAEMLPLQLLTLHLAKVTGVVAGEFRHSGKVTAAE